jgi:hypothetical protein
VYKRTETGDILRSVVENESGQKDDLTMPAARQN